MDTVDLRNCKKGDILISSLGAKLEYIGPTPWWIFRYLDHVVRYIEDKDGNSFGEENYGTRTHDGLVYRFNRNPETDHDIFGVMKNEISDLQTIEEILMEANAYGLKLEVQEWANKLIADGESELKAYQIAFSEWVK